MEVRRSNESEEGGGGGGGEEKEGSGGTVIMSCDKGVVEANLMVRKRKREHG